jgi:hypothetical protein
MKKKEEREKKNRREKKRERGWCVGLEGEGDNFPQQSTATHVAVDKTKLWSYSNSSPHPF